MITLIQSRRWINVNCYGHNLSDEHFTFSQKHASEIMHLQGHLPNFLTSSRANICMYISTHTYALTHQNLHKTAFYFTHGNTLHMTSYLDKNILVKGASIKICNLFLFDLKKNVLNSFIFHSSCDNICTFTHTYLTAAVLLQKYANYHFNLMHHVQWTLNG